MNDRAFDINVFLMQERFQILGTIEVSEIFAELNNFFLMRNEPFSSILKIFSSHHQLMLNPHRFGNAESSSTVDHAQLILIVDN